MKNNETINKYKHFVVFNKIIITIGIKFENIAKQKKRVTKFDMFNILSKILIAPEIHSNGRKI